VRVFECVTQSHTVSEVWHPLKPLALHQQGSTCKIFNSTHAHTVRSNARAMNVDIKGGLARSIGGLESSVVWEGMFASE